MTLNTDVHDFMHKKVLEELKLSPGDDFFVNQIFSLIKESFLRGENPNKYVNEIKDTYQYDFDFVSALKDFDFYLSSLPYDFTWSLYVEPPNFIHVDDLSGVVKEAFFKLKQEQDFVRSLFYYQVICFSLVGGISDSLAIEEIDYSFYLKPFEAVKPKAIVFILQKEYVGEEFVVKSVPDFLEPLDTSFIPEYLMSDNDQIFYVDGKPYLKIDFLRAITAAGGVAQTLEKQDLEGKVTNANDKSDNKKRKSSESVDREESGFDSSEARVSGKK